MTGAPGNSPFSAADPTLGYLYQVRLALLLALRRLKTDQNFLVSIETLDDVTFETAGGDAADLLQTKHHRTGSANLTDASTDLWKTLRIWFSGRATGQILPHTNLFLVTTGIAPPNSAASRLRSADRDVPAARAVLDATAQTSVNVTNREAYQTYLTATPAERTAILGQIEVIDGASTVSDLEAQLRAEIRWAANKDHLTAFLDRLEGWWLRRVLRQLTDSPTGRIGAAELESEMSDLRESFKQDALPIDEDLLDFTLDDATREAHDGSIFVWQMEIINAGKKRIAAAVRDYYRAFEQRSRWLREDLVVDMDLSKYEKRLSEQWELIFEAARDELGTSPSQEIKEGAARSVLAWAERAQVSIRPQVTEPFVCRGSLHMLSDEGRVGWHPEFQDRLAVLLRDRGSTGGTT
jgi:hypothetical protein